MNEKQPLTLTVEQVAEILGVARSTAYELVRSGDIESIRLRRRIVVPVKLLADQLGVTPAAVWDTLAGPTKAPNETVPLPPGRPRRGMPRPQQQSLFETVASEAKSVFASASEATLPASRGHVATNS